MKACMGVYITYSRNH